LVSVAEVLAVFPLVEAVGFSVLAGDGAGTALAGAGAATDFSADPDEVEATTGFSAAFGTGAALVAGAGAALAAADSAFAGAGDLAAGLAAELCAMAGLAASGGFAGVAGAAFTDSALLAVFVEPVLTGVPVDSFFFGINHSSELLDEFQGATEYCAGAASGLSLTQA